MNTLASQVFHQERESMALTSATHFQLSEDADNNAYGGVIAEGLILSDSDNSDYSVSSDIQDPLIPGDSGEGDFLL